MGEVLRGTYEFRKVWTRLGQRFADGSEVVFVSSGSPVYYPFALVQWEAYILGISLFGDMELRVGPMWFMRGAHMSIELACEEERVG